MECSILGPLKVLDGDRDLTPRRAKQRALLAVLLVHANRVVSADRLIDALWGEQPPATAVKTLQTYVSQLRRELEPHARPGRWRALQTLDGGYRLQVDADSVDADRFARLVDSGRRALGRGEPAAAAPHVERVRAAR